MPTLGIDFKVSLAVDKTRSHVDSFYRGIKVKGVTLFPYATIGDTKSHTYDVSNTNAIIFVSDVYDGSNPFDITLVTSNVNEETGRPDTIKLQAVGLLIMDVQNISTVIVSSQSEENVAYRIII